MIHLDPTRLETLVLVRVLATASPLSMRELATSLRRFAPTQLSESDWQPRLEQVVTSARAAGRLGAENAPTDPGELERLLGVKARPAWALVADKRLPLLALGVSPRESRIVDHLKDRDAWTAAIAARLLGLWSDGMPPSLSAVCDAYAWRQLGLGGKPKRCPAEVRAIFLQRELQTQTAPPDRLLRLYVARELGAARSEVRALRDALVRRWLEGDPGARAPALTPTFAESVAAVARSTRDGVFGDRKVFISAAWQALRSLPAYRTLTLEDFKRQLLGAHQSGAMVLARADLVAAMDPELVASSETLADGATFHFIVREDHA